MCHSKAYTNVKHKDKQHLHILYNKSFFAHVYTG